MVARKVKVPQICAVSYPFGIAPVMLLLKRERLDKLVKCLILFGSLAYIKLLLSLSSSNLLDVHADKFSKNSVMFPEERLVSSHNSSNSQRFLKSASIVAA
jgi:hypothetical protein